MYYNPQSAAVYRKIIEYFHTFKRVFVIKLTVKNIVYFFRTSQKKERVYF